eukprot:5412966-Karenia_brevis.AAC.1
MVRQSLGMPDLNQVDGGCCFHAFTDGSFTRTSRASGVAGWAFALFNEGELPEKPCEDRILQLAKGPVVVDKRSQYFIGAEVKSNNTAELSACIEFFFWLLAQVASSNPIVKLGSSVTLHTDSKYVLGLAQNKFRPRENINMAL